MKKDILMSLKLRRKELGFTQQEVADFLGMKKESWRDIENCKSRIRLEDFLLVCKFLKIDPISLVKDTDDVIISLSREQIDVIDDIHNKIHNQVNISKSIISGDIVFGNQYKK